MHAPSSSAAHFMMRAALKLVAPKSRELHPQVASLNVTKRLKGPQTLDSDVATVINLSYWTFKLDLQRRGLLDGVI